VSVNYVHLELSDELFLSVCLSVCVPGADTLADFHEIDEVQQAILGCSSVFEKLGL